MQFGGRLFHQMIGIPIRINCAPFPLLIYENEFLDNMIRSGHRRLARSFNLCYRYIDDLIVFNNKKFLDYLNEIYPSQLTVEKANKSDHLADYLDLTLIIDSGGKLSTRLYDKRDDFEFHIVNFPFLSRVLGQKPPRQKPPRHKPPDKNPLCQKPPRQNILFRNFITFVFRMSYGKEISIWFLAVKYVRHGSIT